MHTACPLQNPECCLELQGATVLDFAYHVHTDVGNHMIGAKVNGKYVTASHQLANSEIVDILTYDGPLTKNLVARHQVCVCLVAFCLCLSYHCSVSIHDLRTLRWHSAYTWQARLC